MPDSVCGTPVTTSLLTSGEKLYSPAGLAKVLNVPGHRGGPHLNGSTVFRFITKGKWANGELVRLEAVRVGDRWLTSVESFSRFTAKLTEASLPADDTPPAEPAPTPKQRRRAATTASAKLDAILG
jgi:hypothetical protein